MNDKERMFIDLYCIKKINEWKQVAENEPIKDINELKDIYGSIDGYIANKIGVDINEVAVIRENLQEEISIIQEIFNKFNEKRKEGFKTFDKFLEWYRNQSRKCYYCQTSEEAIKNLFKVGVFNPKKKAWTKGSLQIEKLDPNAEYSKTNCVLACVFCNNAKSDLMTDKEFKDFFGEPMKKYLEFKIKQNDLKQ